MRVTAVMGSPTKDGNTCVLAREVLRGAAAAGAEVDEIFLAEHRIEFCHGCISRNVKTNCLALGRCVIPDDVNALRRRLYESDGIVLASPSYGIKPTARMKNFITDRMGMYTVYTSSLGGKYFVGVSTCGGIGAARVARELAEDFVAGFHRRGYLTGSIGVKLGRDRIEERPEALAKAYRLGQRLAEDIRVGRRYLFQKLFDRALTALVVRRLILRNIYQNREGMMKAVYENLLERGLIRPAGNGYERSRV
jgi:NAD(P)H-dependent FMN reductase